MTEKVTITVLEKIALSHSWHVDRCSVAGGILCSPETGDGFVLCIEIDPAGEFLC
jgi:hypothetical protein